MNVTLLAAIAGYVLTALGTYSIAKRRGINKPWTAWVPIANLWLLGCISDQYRHIVKGQVKTKRRSLVTLSIVTSVAAALLICLCVSMIIDIFPYLPSDISDMPIEDFLNKLSVMSEDELESFIDDAIQRMSLPSPDVQQIIQIKATLILIFSIIFSVAGIILGVQNYMAHFDLFASANPRNASMYLTLGILEQAIVNWGILLPVFVYLCRNKDEGMPQRPANIVDVSPVWDESDPPCYEI